MEHDLVENAALTGPPPPVEQVRALRRRRRQNVAQTSASCAAGDRETERGTVGGLVEVAAC